MKRLKDFMISARNGGGTGSHGALIPAVNKKNLMLRRDIIQAVELNRFHIYAIETVEEGMELLTGLNMGTTDKEGRYPDDSVNYKITQQLDQLAEKRKAFAAKSNGQED